MVTDTPEYKLAEKRQQEYHEKHNSTYNVHNRSDKFNRNTCGNTSAAVSLDRLFRTSNLVILEDGRSFNEVIHTVDRSVDRPDFLFFINKYEMDMWNKISLVGNVVQVFDKGAHYKKQAIMHKDLMQYKLVLQYPREDKPWQSHRYEIPANKKLNILDGIEDVIYNKDYKYIHRIFPDKS